jgi:hypothetical protein
VGELLGLLVERGSQAALSLCTLSSERAEQQQVALLPLPPAPKPGFLPSFAPAVPGELPVTHCWLVTLHGRSMQRHGQGNTMIG